MLDTLGRAKPEAFAHYSVGSNFLNSTLLGKPKRLLNLIYSNAYSTRRHGKLRFHDSSHVKFGRQSIHYRIDDTTKHFSDEWTLLSNKKYHKNLFEKNIFKFSKLTISFIFVILLWPHEAFLFDLKRAHICNLTFCYISPKQDSYNVSECINFVDHEFVIKAIIELKIDAPNYYALNKGPIHKFSLGFLLHM